MTVTPISAGDVVQLDASDQTFAFCLMFVTDVYTWGVQGVVRAPTARDQLPVHYAYRARFEHVVRIGRAHWELTI